MRKRVLLPEDTLFAKSSAAAVVEYSTPRPVPKNTVIATGAAIGPTVGRQREYRQMHRQDLVCQCCGEKFTTKRAGARYCSNACRQKDYRKRVTYAASAQNEHLVNRNASAK